MLYHAGDASATTTSNVVWYKWTANTSSAAASAPTAVWIRWYEADEPTTADTTEKVVWGSWAAPGHYKAREVTPEERQRLEAEHARRAAETQARVESERREREAADKKAEKLLIRHLDRAQRKSYRRGGAFHVTGSRGGRYRIRRGWAGNVEELNASGQAISRLCIHPHVFVPHADNCLAQKLCLEADEDGFRRTANRTPIPAPSG